MKIVCIGAAPTGLGAAFRLHELQESGDEKALDTQLVLFEQEPYAGGLSCTVKDKNGFLWDMGGHITFDHNYPYYGKATKWAVEEWNQLTRNCMVDMNYLYKTDGLRLVPYPAQFAVPLFPAHIKEKCLMELNERYQQAQSTRSVHNFEDWVLEHFGPTILDVFFRPYTKKVWTVDPVKMSPNWVGTRVAKLPKEKLESLCAMNEKELETADFGWGPNSFFTFPKYGGTGNVWESMRKKLPTDWFKLGTKVLSVDHKNKTIRYLEEGQEKEMEYDALINTTPIDLLVEQTKICPPLNLAHNKVVIVGVGMHAPMTPLLEQFTWLYFPDRNVPFFRVTILSRYGEVTPDSSKYWSIMCECALQIDDPTTEEQVVEKTLNGLVVKGMITRDKIASVYSITLPYGYPIPTPNVIPFMSHHF
ncbi:hypothetical protein WR25_06258 isoform A [Diploscapter pachys]|uniref:Amine oxidase domain-containing protein n=1 Tax=Diploscapter pachys TaxID=2018661 RepID=A0A2A2LXV5_9BILA|nr:hypothetical protein WR25_06258 isoform A [Diploscapter pachys]